ncbi:hypothetical protein [Microbacterium sp. YJN-G]|uniref:hypothetical protein n=1 Tax=Microbacterium sp. YJN-G TaxID=2763257 RepID=UPI001878AE55|nr:hypothetical protein [Microbacterium sp. YJN-G]
MTVHTSLLHTRTATVLDAGDGAELCLGMIATSLPPQCGGPELVGWDWSQWSGAYEDVAGVRWGEFVLTGVYDATVFAFTPSTVKPWDASTAQQPEDPSLPDFTTPCDAPEGGWRVLDPARTTIEAMDRAFQHAAQLDGYAASWVDRARVPVSGPGASPEEQLEATAVQPELTIVNVTVVGDRAAAEESLREIWGGMLCVTTAQRTEAELQRIVDELLPRTEDIRMLSVVNDGMSGTVVLDVVHDDGALQAEMDERYGEGVVEVVSALTPVD